MSKIKSKFLCFLTLTFCLLSMQPVFAENVTNLENKAEIIQYLNENGVSIEQQKTLIDKLENNQLWDASNPDKLSLVPENFYVFDPKTSDGIRYYRFEDGSFIKIEATPNAKIELNGTEESNQKLKEKVTNPEALAMLQAQNNPRTRGYQTGTGYAWYYDYRVSYFVGVTMGASMYTEFVLVNGGNDYLVPTGFYGPTASGFGELGQMPTIQIVRQTEDSSTSRWAIANSNWYVNYPISTPWGGSTVAGTKYLWIGVGSDTFKVSDSLPY
ncbi:MAG: hypothetical protein FWC47_02695 [Oscillospiraceae bacterium]|nr:hypothetical protein [Oscillospiraceae bacterium]